MAHLAQALQKYYLRHGKKIVFHNNLSMNQLALMMWESLGCREIDASVLSRVLKGERLFLPRQLKVFCELLNVPPAEEQRLSECLRMDSAARLGLDGGTTNHLLSVAQEAFHELASDSFGLFYSGQYETLGQRYHLLQRLTLINSSDRGLDQPTAEALGTSLYFYGRAISSSELPSRVVAKVTPIYRQLDSMSREYHSSLLYGYACSLLCDAYYGAGGYSDASAKRKYYALSIKYAKKAIDILSEDNHEALFALRTMAASGYYMRDHEAVEFVVQQVKRTLPQQAPGNYVNGIHLGMTVSKCLAASGSRNPFLVQDMVDRHFSQNLAGTGAYEISGIKEDLETMALLKSSDEDYMRDQAQEGLRLANQYQLTRHSRYFKRLINSF